MPLIRSSPWTDAANVGEGLGGSITQLLYKLPELRLQQELLRQHALLYGHQGALYDAEALAHKAQAGLYSAEATKANAEEAMYRQKTDEGTSAETAKKQLGTALWSIQMAQEGGLPTSSHVARAVDAMARLPDKDRSDLAKNFAQMMQMHDPRFQKALGLGTKQFESVPSGNTLYDVLGQQPQYQAPIRLGEGQGLYPQTGGDAIAQGPAKSFAPTSLGGALGPLLSASNVSLDPELQSALAKTAALHIMKQLGGTNAPTMAAPTVPARKVVRDPSTGELILQ